MLGAILGKALGLTELIFGVMDRINLSPEDSAEMEQKLATHALVIQKLEVETEVRIMEEAGKNLRVEMASKSWLARNWRPMFCVNMGAAIVFNLWVPMWSGSGLPAVAIPAEYFYLFGAAFLGYGGMRTFEKFMGAKITKN